MNQDILLSKIVPNTTDSTWSQAYTTLNVYMTLSIENDTPKTPVTSYGKEILEKLQREFFALDQKSLEEIKKAVSNVTKTIDTEYKYSIVIGAIVNNVLYIVTASKGRVVIKREGKIGTIAQGEENELIGFSGELQHNDIVIFETGDFAEKINSQTLQDYLASSDVSQIAENITPLIHGQSKGTESAIIIQYKDLSNPQEKAEEVKTIDTQDEPNEDSEEEKLEDEALKENLWTTAQSSENRNIENLEDGTDEAFETNEEAKSSRLSFIPKIKLPGRRIIIILIILLVAILIGGIYFQNIQSQNAKKKAEFEKIYTPSKSAFESAVNLDELETLLASVNSSTNNFPENSEERKNLESLKSDIEKKIAEMEEASSAKNLKEVIKAGGNTLSSIDLVTLKGADIVVASSKDKKVAIIEDGKISKDFEVEDSIKFVSADTRFIYTVGMEGITQIDRGNGNTKVVVKKADGIAFDVFASNLYLLSEDDIRRMRSPGFSDASYFTKATDFSKTPIDMSISGSIFVLEEGGVTERFTKGAKEDFEVKGLSGTIGDNAKIYTDGEFENIYILDVKNQRVVSITNDGNFKKEYKGSFIKNAKSFSIDEKANTAYVVSDNTLYSFDL